ncbi:MAG: DUF2339 domain-containing protein [Clostridiales bacterium]|nr:DUF2339 domain-containing protein [Clostridiales bacterium]
MTSATFSDKGLKAAGLKRAPLRFFGWSLRKNMLITGIASILALLISPGIPLMNYYAYLAQAAEIQTDIFRNIEDTLPIVCILLSLLAGLQALVLSSLNYRYMHHKAASDLFHALPLTRTRMLLGRFLSVFLMSLAPVAVGLCGLAAAVALTPLTGLSAPLFCRMLAGIAVLCFACASFTALIAVSAGSGFDMFAALLVTNIGWPVICILFSGLCQSQLTGYPGLTLTLQDEVYFLFSPFGRLLGFSFRSAGRTFAWFEGAGQDLRFFGLWILLGLVFLAAALILYKRRKSEAAGSPYAFQYLPVLLQMIAAVIGGAALGVLFGLGSVDTLSFYIFMAVGAALGGLIPGAIFSRGFKRLKRDMIVAGCVFLVMLAVIGVISSGGLGYESRVPSLSSVNSVSMDFHLNASYYGSTSVYEENDTGNYQESYAADTDLDPAAVFSPTTESLVFTEQTDIQNIQKLHTAVVEWLSANKSRRSGERIYDALGDREESDGNTVVSLGLTYYTKWGGRIIRQYNLWLSAFTEELAPIFSSPVYLRAAYPKLYDEKGFASYPAVTIEDKKSLNAFTDQLSQNALEDLRTAYLRDLSQPKTAQTLLQRQPYEITLRPVSMNDSQCISLPVYEGYTHTLQYLKRMGYADRLGRQAGTAGNGQQPAIWIPADGLSALDGYEGHSNLSLLAYLYHNRLPVGFLQDDVLVNRLFREQGHYGSLEGVQAANDGAAVVLVPSGDPYGLTLAPAADWPEDVQAAPLDERQYEIAQYYFTRAVWVKS